MKISEILSSGHIVLDVEAGNKEELIKRLVNELRREVDDELLQQIKKAVIEREEVMSTGVGKGVAIPHAKIRDLEPNYAVFARLKRPIDFGSVDDAPVSLVFLLVGGCAKSSYHIKLLSKISRLMNHDNFRHQLMMADSAAEVVELFREEEEQPV